MKEIEVVHSGRKAGKIHLGRLRFEGLTEDKTGFPAILFRGECVDSNAVEVVLSGLQGAEIHIFSLSGPAGNCAVVAKAPVENSGEIQRDGFEIVPGKLILEIQCEIPFFHLLRVLFCRQKAKLVVLVFSLKKFPGAVQVKVSGDSKNAVGILHFHQPGLAAEHIFFSAVRRHGYRFPVNPQFYFPVERQICPQEQQSAWDGFLFCGQAGFPAEPCSRLLLHSDDFGNPEAAELSPQ